MEFNINTLSNDLFENVKDQILENLEDEILKLSIDIQDFNVEYVNKQIERGQSLVSLSFFNQDIYNSEKDKFKKENYIFPSLMHLGSLENWSTTPSRFLNNKRFHNSIPFFIPVEKNPFIFIQNTKKKDLINSIIENISLKLIASLPNSLSRSIIIDKTGSGQNFPNMIKLNEKFNDNKIITEDYEIEEELLRLKHSINTITSSITTNGFSSIEDYNNNTDEVPQPYRILNIANFPIGFSKKSTEALLSILESGSKVGIYTIMSVSVNMKLGLNQNVSGLPLTEILKHAFVFDFLDRDHEYLRAGLLHHNISLMQTPLVKDDNVREFVNNKFKIKFESFSDKNKEILINDLNDRIKDVNIKPIIDIKKTIPKEFWNGESGPGVTAPFAKNGIENVYLSLGINQFGEDESTHHALIGGATGSGKTVLLHSMILHMSMKYSPEQLQFWLLDYKEGTEFATYKDFPHVNILSMQSEVEFGQEVLENAQKIMAERGKLFKEAQVSNLKNYNKWAKKNGRQELYRILIIVDEFQALFPKNPKIISRSNVAIDKILRLGRSFGVNIMLATQTLKGLDMDPQLMSNIPLRIGLKMDKKDISKMFEDNNTAVATIQDPGEGIYNKQFGISTANLHFQGYLALNDQVDYIKGLIKDKMNDTYEETFINDLYESKFIYSGDSEAYYANIENSKNQIFIGEYAGLSKDHSYLSFDGSFGDNLIITGTDSIKSISLMHYANTQLSKYSKTYFASFNKNSNKYFNADKIYTNKDFEIAIKEIKDELDNRATLENFDYHSAQTIYLFGYFVDNSVIFSNSSSQEYKDLMEIITNGPELGIHTVLYATTYSAISKLGLNRVIDKFRKRISLTSSDTSLKIFEDSNILIPSSPYISFCHTGESGTDVFKFKPYILKELSTMEDEL